MPTDNFYDVAVIGSGPAGSVAAQKLSSSGLKVILFEKASLPRYKTCGGGIIKRAIKYLPPEVSSVLEKQFRQIEIFDHQADFNYSVKRNFPLVYLTMRNNFDFILTDEAKKSGTEIFDNCEVRDLLIEEEFVLLRTSKNEFKSLFVIGADGAQGISVKKSGLKLKKKNLPALECEVIVPSEELLKYNFLRFDFGFIPGGYAWVFPKEDHLSIGLGIFALRDINKNLNIYFKDYLYLLGIKKIISTEKHGFYIPVSLAKNKVAGKRILLSGDAAALADPVTAEGISSAILSANLAAESIVEGKLNPDAVSDLYQKKIDENFYSELNAGLLLSKSFYNYERLRIFLIKRYGVEFCNLIAYIISGEKRYHQLIKNPFNYLKLVRYYFNPLPHHLKPEHNI
jgi:geranylgeranyl reductase family protein